MTLVTPRIVNNVSFVSRINHEIHFSWQAQYLVKLKCHFSWQAQYSVQVVPGRAGGGSFRRKKVVYSKERICL